MTLLPPHLFSAFYQQIHRINDYRYRVPGYACLVIHKVVSLFKSFYLGFSAHLQPGNHILLSYFESVVYHTSIIEIDQCYQN